ncbi:glycosyltransferase family 2 protein [Candidatus Falkowbacteria bacterium]|nr:glycosyltransferase family 2 protein [Candidatus Falkowbacteria bacterium]
MKVFIVIPAYNEERNILEVVRNAKEHGEVVVVDDGSGDRTSEIVQGLGVKVLRHIINRGQGASLKTGIDYALASGAEIIVTIDGDGQHLASEIPKFLEIIEKQGVDVVLGSRFLDTDSHGLITDSHGSRINEIPWTKKWLILKPAIFFTKISSGLELSDVHQGFRAMTREAAEMIEMTQDGMAHASEIISEIKKNKLTFREVGIRVIYNDYGQGMGGGVRILRDLLFKKIIN